MRPLDFVLGRLESLGHNPKKSGAGWKAHCPGHDDSTASLSITEGDDGRVLLHDFGGCATEHVVASMGLTMSDLFPGGGGGGAIPPRNLSTAQPDGPTGLSLDAYAAAKRLPVAFLKSLGLSDIFIQGTPVVRIPYFNEDGSDGPARFRWSLSGKRKFTWRKGSKPQLYGLFRLQEARDAGYCVLVEGESDVHTLLFHGIPALGVPGAANWREDRDAPRLDGIEEIYVVIEPDRGGEGLQRWLQRSRIRQRVRVLRLPGFKDPSEMYLADPEGFKAAFQKAMDEAPTWAALAAEQKAATRRAAATECEELAESPDILAMFAADLRRRGVIGEDKCSKILFLALVSRLLDRPISVVVKGPSSAGKSFIVVSTLAFFPASAYYELTGVSERVLAYSEEPLEHRFIVIVEASGMDKDFVMYLLRTLLSEGRVRYETLEKTPEGLRARLIERNGPTGLIVTTTAVNLHPENETRMLTITVTDTQEQTKAILSALAEEPVEFDMGRWHALQVWLETGPQDAVIPFAKRLTELIPPIAVRLRRDAGALLRLIKAHALLHQASRGRDDRSRVVATIEDYAAVRELVAGFMATGVEATVPEIVRETVAAVAAASGGKSDGVTIAAVARELGLDKSAAWRRVKTAIALGYLVNKEERRGHPAKLFTDEPLPEDQEILPSPEALHEGCTGAEDAGDRPPSPSPLEAEDDGEEAAP